MALLQQQCERYNLGRRTKFLNVAPSASGESARGQAGLSDQAREEVEPDSAAYQVLTADLGLSLLYCVPCVESALQY